MPAWYPIGLMRFTHQGRFCEMPGAATSRSSPRHPAWEANGTFSAHSYRSASTGSSFEARNAGTIPLSTPTNKSTMLDNITVSIEIRR